MTLDSHVDEVLDDEEDTALSADELWDDLDADDEHLSGLVRLGLPVRHLPAGPDGSLTPEAVRLIGHAWSTSTRRAYEATWADFTEFCARHALAPIDADPTLVCNYVGHHYALGLSPNYLDRKLAALSTIFTAAGRVAPTGHRLVRAAVKGGRRLADRPTRQAAPIRLHLLQELVVGMAIRTGRPPHDPRVRRDRALLLVGWHGALRASEIAALDVEHLAFIGDPNTRSGGVQLHLGVTKTESSALVSVPYARSESACPVNALRHLARDRRHGPLFTSISRHGREGRRLNPTSMTSIVRRHLVATDPALNPDVYSSHSLRSGWITEARARGLPDADILRHARQVDDRMLLTYDRPGNPFETAAAHAVREW